MQTINNQTFQGVERSVSISFSSKLFLTYLLLTCGLVFFTVAQSTYINTNDFSSCDASVSKQVAIVGYSSGTYTYEKDGGSSIPILNSSITSPQNSPTIGLFTITMTPGTYDFFRNGTDIGDVVFIQSSGNISISLSETTNEGCDGETIILTPSGGSNYVWKRDGVLVTDLTPDPVTYALTVPFVVGSTITYQVSGDEDVCGEPDSDSVPIIGRNEVSDATISGPSDVCHGTESSVFTYSANNVIGGWTWSTDPVGAAESFEVLNATQVRLNWDTDFISSDASQTITITGTAQGNCDSESSAEWDLTYYQPKSFTLDGGGESCAVTDEHNIKLLNSEVGVTYRLYRSGNATAVGTVVSSGGQVNFGNFSNTGTYYAEGSIGGCSAVEMSNDVVIGTKTPGNISISLSETTNEGCGGETIILTPSGGSNYVWYRDDVEVTDITPDPVTHALTVPFVANTTITYKVSGAEDECGFQDDDSVPIIGRNEVSNATISGTLNVCDGTESSVFTFSASNVVGGWTWSTDPAGAAESFESAGSGQIRLNWDPDFTISGASETVKVIGTAMGNCDSEAEANWDLTYYQPTAFILSGGGESCSTSDPHEIRLLNSESNVTYRLYREGNPTAINTIIGTDGQEIDFGDFTNEGTYYVEGSISNCITLRMANDVTIEQLVHGTVSASIQLSGFTNPVVSGGPFFTCTETDIYTLTHNYSGFDANWEWYVNGSPVSNSADEVTIVPELDGVYSIQYSNVNITANCQSISDLSPPSSPVIHLESAEDLENVNYSFSDCDLSRINELAGIPDGYQVNWYDDEGAYLNSGISFNFIGLEVGVHEYLIRAESETYGCLSANAATVTVEIHEPLIDITFPSENEIVWREDSYEIAWTHNYVPNSSEVNFFLVRGGQSIALADPNNWTIAADQALDIDYRIKASICGYDFYSGYFRIGDPFPRELITPEDMALVIQGANELVSWTEDNEHHFNIYHAPLNDPTDRVELDPTGSYSSATDVSSFNWIIENTILGDRLVIVEEEHELWSYEANVEVVEPLDIITPNSATVYGLGERMQITWEGASIKPNRLVTVTLKWYDMVTENELGSQVISTIKKSGRHYEWRVDPDLNEDYKYKIYLSQELQPVEQTPVRLMTDESTEFFLVQDCPNAPKVANLDYNYIKIYTPRIQLSGCVSAQDDASKVHESIQFFDGLARPQQSVVRQFTADKRDLVTQLKYDAFGRQVGTYLPFKSTSDEGLYVSDWETPQKDFYDPYGERDYAFSETVFENSPLSRPVAQAAPGEVWSKDYATSHLVDHSYRTNTVAEVRKIDVIGGAMFNQSTSTHFEAEELYVNTTKDENEGDLEGEVIEFTDKNGRVILKKVKILTDAVTDVITYASTYYVYDDFDNLRFVIQPEGVRRLDAGEFSWNQLDDETLLSRWVFAYEYDHRQRMIAKRVPGSDWTFMVYDKRDRLVLTQDGNQRLFETLEDGEIVSVFKGKSYYVPSGSVTLGEGFQASASATTSFKITTDTDQIVQEWLYTKYDPLNRPVLTGKVTLNGNHNDQQSALNDWNGEMTEVPSLTYDQNFGGYTNQSFPTQVTDADLLTVSYYDDYDFLPHGELDEDSNIETDVKGLNTGSLIKVLGSTDELLSVQYYDNKLRTYKTYAENILDVNGSKGSDEVELTYESEVSPIVVQTDLIHAGPEGTYHVREATTYDQMSRPKLMKHQFGPVGSLGSEVVIASNTYNDLGQLVQKNLGVTITPLQKVDYKYNIRGWLTDMNHGAGLYDANDKFVMQLSYQEASTDYVPNYNGNISEMMWQTTGGNGDQTTAEQRFRYTYDAMNRLSSGTYVGGPADGAFDVSNLSYDYNGNIGSLTRKQYVEITPVSGPAFSAIYGIDQLVYEYSNGNQLSKVTDSGETTLIDATVSDPVPIKDIGFRDGVNLSEEYQYDDNGNMIADQNKGISSIIYNHLNLPEQVTTTDASITYTYDALGVKLQKTVLSGANNLVTSYVNGIHYSKETSGSHELEFIQHSEGRLVNSETDWDYEYNLTDHLGNVRVTIDDSGNIIQRDDYYPFGGTFNSSATSPENLYKYNGKEEQPETAWLDYGARMQDPWLGRFFTQDRFAEKYYDLAPYQYTANNPINYVDINGDSIKIVNGEETFVYTEGAEYDGENEFITNAVGDLNKIAGTKKGAKRIGDLVESESVYNIKEAQQLAGRNGSRYEANENGGGDLYYYQKGGIADGVSFHNSMFVVGHELQHAWDHDQGREEYLTTKTKGVVTSEINAVAFENYLRATAGETKMRTNYTGTRIFNNSSPEFFMNKPDPLRKNEGLWRPDFYVSPSTDATYVAPNIRAFRINKQSGKIVNPNQ